MTWVPLQESGLQFNVFTQNGATLESSIAEAIDAEPSLDGTLVTVVFNSGVEFQENIDLGWSGRVRMTVQSYHAVSPGSGQPFEASEMAQRAGGDALVSRVINEQPPYPDTEWSDDDVTGFNPTEFIGDVFAEMIYLDGTWVGPEQVFALRTVSMVAVSYEVLFDVEIDDVPSGFWTNLVNVMEV